jgi:hypothetical protein
MADQETPGRKQTGRKQPARKKKVDLKDLSGSNQELSKEQAQAVKGGDLYMRGPRGSGNSKLDL